MNYQKENNISNSIYHTMGVFQIILITSLSEYTFKNYYLLYLLAIIILIIPTIKKIYTIYTNRRGI